MKALILNGSPHPQGVVVQALRTAADTLRQAGADIEWIDVYRTEFRPCTGCMQCRATNVCPLPRDAAHAVGERIRQAGLLVVGTPTYWGGMSARLKMLFERLVPVFMGESALGLPQPRQKGKRVPRHVYGPCRPSCHNSTRHRCLYDALAFQHPRTAEPGCRPFGP